MKTRQHPAHAKADPVRSRVARFSSITYCPVREMMRKGWQPLGKGLVVIYLIGEVNLHGRVKNFVRFSGICTAETKMM